MIDKGHGYETLPFPNLETLPDQTETPRLPFAPTGEELAIWTDGRIETPIDERGVVDLRSLIETMHSFVPDGYEWRGEEDKHHLYWMARLYSKPHLFAQDEETIRLLTKFRNLPINMISIPRGLHDFIHSKTEAVDPPDLEVVQFEIESWTAAVSLFNSATLIRELGEMSEEEMAASINKKIVNDNLSKIEKELKRCERLPSPFRYFNLRPFERLAGCPRSLDPWKNEVKRACRKSRTVGEIAARGARTLEEIEVLRVQPS